MDSASQPTERVNPALPIMTIREIAIKAMEELGYSQKRIAIVLAHMDSHDPKQIGKDPEQIPPEAELSAMESARNYFRRHPDIPMDN